MRGMVTIQQIFTNKTIQGFKMSFPWYNIDAEVRESASCEVKLYIIPIVLSGLSTY